MDIEYLQNVMGSPYVNEGAFSRLKARGAQAMGAMGATMGHQIQNPTETKLRSLWDGFMSSLNKVMSEWQTQVSPMLGPDVKIPKGGKPIKNALDRLAQTLTPYNSQAASPNLKTLAKEGLWDMAKRDMGLNKALASNNPLAILESYKKHILSLFKKFMTDAVKSTNLQPKQIYSTLAKMQPKEGGWQAAGNMQRVVQQLQKLQAVAPTPSAPSSAYGGPVPPVISPSGTTTATPVTPIPPAAPTAPTAAPIPSPSPTTLPKASAAPTAMSLPPTPTSSGGGPTTGEDDGFNIPPNDMPYVILTALNVIIDAVKSDTAHAMGLFGTHPNTKQAIPIPPLSTKWGSGPYVTSPLQEDFNDDEGDEESPDATPVKGDSKDDYHKEFPKQFLYNFHSRYNKYPGRPFTMEIIPVNISPEIKQIPGASVEVWWYNEGPRNRIYVTEIKNGKKSKPSMIMFFYDHQVNPKSGATTPGDIDQFSIEKVVNATNPYAVSKLENALPQVKAEIQKLEDTVLRALLATVQRKSMEFKSKSKAQNEKNIKAAQDAETADVSDDGTLTYIDSVTGKSFTYTKDQLKAILKGPLVEASHMRKLLNDRGYFDTFGDMPSIPQETPTWHNAKLALIAKHIGDKESDKLLANAWMAIKEKDPQTSIWPEDATITPQDLVNACVKTAPPKPPENTPESIVKKIPAAFAAAKALVALDTDVKKKKKSESQKWKDAYESVSQVITTIGTNKTEEEYTKAALAQYKTPPANPTVSAPTSAGEPPKNPVSAPVSNADKVEAHQFKIGDTVDVGGQKVKIKDISAHNVVVTIGTQEHTIAIGAWNNGIKSGNIKPSVDTPEVNPTNPVSAPLSKEPASAPVSKPVSNKKPKLKPKTNLKDKDKGSDDIEGLEETVDCINPFQKENFL